MSEVSAANIKQILTSFDNLIAIYENPLWVKTVTSEDIKIAFKLGFFVEKLLAKFREQNTAADFIKTLKVWGERNNKVLNYDEEFFCKVCDQLLLKFFKCKSINENVIDVAVRMYTSLFPKERLQVVLKNLIMTSASLEAIFDFTVANKSILDTDHLKYELVLNDWIKAVNEGRKEKIVVLVADCLSSFNVESSLAILMGVLALNVENCVTKLILDSIVEKMLDRSILSKQFWLTLIKLVDRNNIGEVSVHYDNFLVSLCNFLVYLGGMMEEHSKTENEIQWISNPNISLCPEIDYQELESIFMFLCKFKKFVIKEYVINRLKQASEATGLSIWTQIMQKCL